MAPKPGGDGSEVEDKGGVDGGEGNESGRKTTCLTGDSGVVGDDEEVGALGEASGALGGSGDGGGWAASWRVSLSRAVFWYER